MTFFSRWREGALKLVTYRTTKWLGRQHSTLQGRFDSRGMDVLSCIVSYNKYGAYCVPSSSSHRPAAQAILLGLVYEPDTIEYILANCKEGDIVQAGAYFGDFLPALSESCGENAKIWSFEPSSENYRCARITLELNGIENVELHNIGLGSEDSEVDLRIRDGDGYASGGGSMIMDSTSSDGSFEKVTIRPIDEVIGDEREVSIIQLDVEGYEINALSGGIKTISRCKPILIVEVHPGSDTLESPWFKENILGLGYMQVGVLYNNLVFSAD